MLAAEEIFEFDLGATHVFRRVGWSLLGLALLRGKGFLALPLALAILGTSGYGFVSVVIAVAAPLVSIALLNIPDGAGRLIFGAPSSALAISRLHKVRRLGLFVSLAFWGCGAVAVAVLGPGVIAWSALIAGSLAFFKVASVHLEYFQRTAKLVRYQVVAEYLAVGIGLVLALWLGTSGMLAANAAIIFAVGLFAWRTLGNVRPREVQSEDPFWSKALALSVPLLPVSVAQWALFSVDSLLIYHLLGRDQAGAYSAAYSIASIALSLPVAVNAVWYPTVLRLLSRSRGEAVRVARKIGIALALMSVLLVIMADLGAPLVRRVLHESVYAAVPRCVVWIVAGFCLLAFTKILEGFVYAVGRPWPIVAAYISGASVNIALNLLWIPRDGIVGAAYATAIGYAVTTMFLFPFAGRDWTHSA